MTTILAPVQTHNDNAAFEAIEHVHDCVKNQLPSFLSAYSLISKEAAQLGWLLSLLVNEPQLASDECTAQNAYKSFFANSGLESLHGAIKLARHYLNENRPDTQIKKVHIVSDNPHYHTLFPSFAPTMVPSLYPELYCSSEAVTKANLQQKNSPLIKQLAVLVYQPTRQFSSPLYQQLIEHCQQHHIIFIVDLALYPIAQGCQLLATVETRPDIVVWGESLGHNTLPFGAFSASNRLYQPWNSLPNCLIHSSTFGGNNLTLSHVLNCLLQSPPMNHHQPLLQHKLDHIAASNHNIVETFTHTVNPYSQLLFKITKMDPLFSTAKGMSLSYMKNGHSVAVLDCLGGGGCTVTGHNNSEFAEQLKTQFNPEHDHWHDLAAQLTRLSGLAQAFPAVSGASAVEIALTLGLNANKGKKTIITFSGNYGGKSLASLSVTAMPSMSAPFKPLYPHVVVINPASPDACLQLNQVLDQQDTALIWFEYMQGMDNTVIDHSLIDIINRRKASEGYYVGTDEVLNGLYRTGSFISSSTAVKDLDIVTFSKGLSGMLVPIAACVVSQSVKHKAQQNAPELYAFYQNYYINQIGAHMGCIVLDYLQQQRVSDNVNRLGNELKQRLEALAGPKELISKVKGEGFNLYLKMNDEIFPFKWFSKIQTIGRPMGSMMFTHICMSRGQLLPFFNRITPPLNCNAAQIDDIVKRMEHIVAINRLQLLLIGVQQLSLIWLVSKGRKLKQWFTRLVAKGQ